jgi:spore maturation protein SpmB
MINISIAVLGGILYAAGWYGAALLLILLAIFSGAGAVVMAISNPDWYFAKRASAGLDVNIFNPRQGIVSLLITKIILVSLLALAAWHIAGKAGYI